MRHYRPIRSATVPSHFLVYMSAVLGFAAPGTALAGPVFFVLGDLPGGFVRSNAEAISADGTTVVGRSKSDLGQEAFRWTSSTGMVGLGVLPGGEGGSWGLGVSADGSVVVGSSSTSAVFNNQAFHWSFGDGMQALGSSPEGLLATSAIGVSGNGQIVAGTASLSTNMQAFRWSSDEGVVLLGTMPGSGGITSATDISGDGSVIVGAGNGTFGREAFRWTEQTGVQGLGHLSGGDFSTAEAVSSDGRFVVGYAEDASFAFRGFRWSEDLGMEVLGDFSALGVSGDGSVVVGTQRLDQPDSRAVIWDEYHGVRDLNFVLETDLGIDLGDWILEWASDVSDDGTVIVGTAFNPVAGGTQAYVAIVPEPCSLILLGVGTLAWRYRRGLL